MISKIFSGVVVGLQIKPIEVEAEVSYGIKSFSIVGLADKSVRESEERIGAALKSSGFKPPRSQPQKIIVGLAPADLKKEGALFDLPIALAYLLASEQAKFFPERKIIAGELALDGKLRPIKGALLFSLFAKENNWKEIIIPKENAEEAGMAFNSETESEKENFPKIIGAESLKEVLDHLQGLKKIEPFTAKEVGQSSVNFANSNFPIDLKWIKGQESSKRAIEIAAAGGHNLLFQGPPGTGKSLLANALPSILPDLSLEESIEVTKIYSVAGLLEEKNPLITKRPFRAPHHTSSEPALIGGGNPPQPGEITLAHRGVLFLDEFPEFHRDVLESMRQPMEDGIVSILRSGHKLVFPSRFSLIAAANPCPCGFYKDPERECKCFPIQVTNYRRKLSGPLMDRIDIFAQVPRIGFEKLTNPNEENSSEKIKERVGKAREIQKQRFEKENIFTNAEMKINQIEKYCATEPENKFLLKKYVDSGKLSGRGYHRILKTARTIADLAESEKITRDHISEALVYRTQED